MFMKYSFHLQMVEVVPQSPPPASAPLISYLHFLFFQNKTITNPEQTFCSIYPSLSMNEIKHIAFVISYLHFLLFQKKTKTNPEQTYFLFLVAGDEKLTIYSLHLQCNLQFITMQAGAVEGCYITALQLASCWRGGGRCLLYLDT